MVYFCSEQEPALRKKERVGQQEKLRSSLDGKRTQCKKWRGVEREWVCGIGGHGGS